MNSAVVAAFFTLHLPCAAAPARDGSPSLLAQDTRSSSHLQRITFALEDQTLTSTNAHVDAATAIYTCSSEAFSPEDTPP